ncbi:MAG: response regulator [Firmicutes bacterium]|nr:response regulator [Bacillota bacterium]
MKLMLIDDDKYCLEALEIFLGMSGYSCASFSDPAKALEVYGADACDAVITDMRMPGMSGIEVMERIRGLDPQAKVIIISGSMDGESFKNACDLGATACLEKPLDASELIRTLREALKAGGGIN